MPSPVPRIRVAGGISARSDRAALVNPVVPISDAIAKTAATVGANANAITQQVLRDTAAADQVNAVEANGRFQRDAKNKIAKLDPLSPKYLQQVQDAYTSAQRDAVGSANLSTPEVLQRLQIQTAAVAERAATSAIGVRKNAIAKRAKQIRAERRAALVENIRNDPDAAAGYLGAHQKTVVGPLTPALEEFGDELALEAQNDFEVSSRAAADGFIDDKRYADGEKLALSVAKQNPTLGKELLTKVKKAQADEDIRQRLEGKGLVGRLQVQATEADPATPALVQRAFKDKFISRGEANRLLKLYGKEQGRRVELQRLQQRAASGEILSSKELEKVYEWQLNEVIRKTADPELRLQIKQKFVSDFGMPKGIKAEVERNENLGTEESLRENAEYMQILTKNGGPISKEFGEQSRLTFQYGTDAASSLGPGGKPDFGTAAKTVINNIPASDDEALKRLTGPRSTFRKDFDENVEDDLKQIIPSGNASVRLQHDFEQQVKRNYMRTGNSEVSRKTAIKQFQEQYGESSINSLKGAPPSTMRFPPGKVALSVPDFKDAEPAELKRQVETVMTNEIRELIAKRYPKQKNASVSPVSDRRTEEEIRTGAPVTWSLRVETNGRVFFLQERIGMMSPEQQRQLLQFEREEQRLGEVKSDDATGIRPGEARLLRRGTGLLTTTVPEQK